MSYASPGRAVAAILLALPGLGAAELVVRDLDLSLAVLPTAFTFDMSSNASSTSGNDAFDSGSTIAIGYRQSITRAGDPVGLVVGLTGSEDSYLYGGTGYLFGLNIRPSAGVGWAPSDRWTMIGELGYSLGTATMQLPETGFAPSYNASGTYRGWDLRTAAWYAAGDQFLIGGLLGWKSGTWALTGDNSTDLQIQQSGWYAGLGISWRFSTDPTTLE